MKTITMLATVALVGLALAAPSQAELPCNGNVIEIQAGTETIYIDDRIDDPNAAPGSGFVFGEGTWIYLESNGETGLQSGGSSPTEQVAPGTGGLDDCATSNPDTLVF